MAPWHLRRIRQSTVPLENCFALDKTHLCGELGYTVDDLCPFSSLLVPFGGSSEIALAAGDTIVVAPATGKFGGGAVMTALAMGARVMACGGDREVLGSMKELFGDTGRSEIVVLTGDETEDARAVVEAIRGKKVVAHIGFSLHAAANLTHISVVMAALKFGGNASFTPVSMGRWGLIIFSL